MANESEKIMHLYQLKANLAAEIISEFVRQSRYAGVEYESSYFMDDGAGARLEELEQAIRKDEREKIQRKLENIEWNDYLTG